MSDHHRASSEWFVYTVQCSDGSLYTGVTTDVQKRVEAHNGTGGAKYTRTRRPVTLAYQEPCQSKSQALKREYEIKRMSRAKKLEMISTLKNKNASTS